MVKNPALAGSPAAVAAATAVACSVAAAPAVSAQAFPTKPIRIIVTSTPSSGPDIIARLIGQKFTEAWQQQIVVDNRAGAAGRIGAEIASRAAPDGYTMMIMTAQHVIVSQMFTNVEFDLVRSFAPISLLATTPFILVVNPSIPAASVKELIALAKTRPGALHYGSGGAGSPPHLSMEIFRSMTGIDLVHVPYKGVTPALMDAVAGQVQMLFVVIPASLPLIKAGKVRALGVSSARRTPLVPDLPTIGETVPGYEFIGWYGLVAPARTPPEILSKLNAEVVKSMKTAELQERVSGLGAEPIGSAPQALATFLRAQIEKLGKAVRESGARRD